MRPINSEQLRIIQLDILKNFIRVCSNNGIPYYLVYGSMLGAVRHKGYIPWDDDIDVGIFRKDVKKLSKLLSDGKYKIINSNIDKKYFSPLLKVFDADTLLIQDYGQIEGVNIGVYVDVFVFDCVPQNELQRKKFYEKAEKLRFQWSLSCRKFTARSKNCFIGFFKSLFSIPFKVIGYHYFANRYLKYSSSWKDEGLYGIVVYSEGFEKEFCYTIKDLSEVKVRFEDMDVSIPAAYENALKKCYGDYMILPPVEERKRHRFNAYVK